MSSVKVRNALSTSQATEICLRTGSSAVCCVMGSSLLAGCGLRELRESRRPEVVEIRAESVQPTGLER